MNVGQEMFARLWYVGLALTPALFIACLYLRSRTAATRRHAVGVAVLLALLISTFLPSMRNPGALLENARTLFVLARQFATRPVESITTRVGGSRGCTPGLTNMIQSIDSKVRVGAQNRSRPAVASDPWGGYAERGGTADPGLEVAVEPAGSEKATFFLQELGVPIEVTAAGARGQEILPRMRGWSGLPTPSARRTRSASIWTRSGIIVSA